MLCMFYGRAWNGNCAVVNVPIPNALLDQDGLELATPA